MSTIFNTSTYQPPGVYVSEESTPLVSIAGIQPTVVGIVGPGIGFRQATEVLALSSTTPRALVQTGIDQASIVVTGIDGVVHAPDQYALVVAPGADGSLTATEDNTTTIARAASSTIANGATIYVTYRYTDLTYRAPGRFNDFDDVKAAYGEPLDLTSGTILSPLSLAAKIAFENGATTLVLVDCGGSPTAVTRSQIQAGYGLLDALFDVNIIVPLSVGITGTPGSPGDTANVGLDLKNFVEGQAALGNPRVGVFGLSRLATVVPSATAATVHSKRVVLAWPNRMSYYDGFSNKTFDLAGYYLAAAYAGRMANLPVQTPLTRKAVQSFVGIPASVANTQTLAVRNSYSAAGVAVTEVARDGTLVVRHGTTTDPTTQTTRELNLVRAGDALVSLLQNTIEASGLIGSTINVDTPLAVKGVITGVLDTAKNNNVIVDFDSLKVRIQSADPTVIEVKFVYTPAYPLNFITVQFSINTASGVVAGLAA